MRCQTFGRSRPASAGAVNPQAGARFRRRRGLARDTDRRRAAPKRWGVTRLSRTTLCGESRPAVSLTSLARPRVGSS